MVFSLTLVVLTACVILQIYPGDVFLILLNCLKLERKLKLKSLNTTKRLTKYLLVSNNLNLTHGPLLKKNILFLQKLLEKLSALQITGSSLHLRKVWKALSMFLKCHGPKRQNTPPSLLLSETPLRLLS